MQNPDDKVPTPLKRFFADNKSLSYQSSYSSEQQAIAEEIRDLMDSVYVAKNFFINYQKNCITVKAEKVTGSLPNTPNMNELNQITDSNGYIKSIRRSDFSIVFKYKH